MKRIIMRGTGDQIATAKRMKISCFRRTSEYERDSYLRYLSEATDLHSFCRRYLISGASHDDLYHKIYNGRYDMIHLL